MNIRDIELVIPTEEMLYILKNCGTQSFVMLDVPWKIFNKDNPCIPGKYMVKYR
jgi:hypothetical protein